MEVKFRLALVCARRFGKGDCIEIQHLAVHVCLSQGKEGLNPLKRVPELIHMK